jgi:predicted dehydrogenase
LQQKKTMGLLQIFWSTPPTKIEGCINVGILGAANIAPMACINPLKNLPNGKAYAIAARDRTKAEKFAKANGVPVVHDTYDAVIADPNVHAIFNPLPNGLHMEWSIKALRAGKHVLCEKPLTSTAEQARKIKEVLEEMKRQNPTAPPLVFAEAFHWKCHPLAHFLRDVIVGSYKQEGWDLGKIERVDTSMKVPSFAVQGSDIRYNFQLAGGTLMDCCYVISTSRYIAQAAAIAEGKLGLHEDDLEKLLAFTVPTVESAEAVKWDKDPNIDLKMESNLVYPETNIKSKTVAAMGYGLFQLEFNIVIHAENGKLSVTNFIVPFIYHAVTFEKKDGTRMYKKVYGDVRVYEM